jgi:hypothetical protein
MCASFRQLDLRTRRLLAAGNFSLALAFVFGNFTQHQLPRLPWLDGVYGLLLGVSIGINLIAVRCIRRRRATEPVSR